MPHGKWKQKIHSVDACTDLELEADGAGSCTELVFGNPSSQKVESRGNLLCSLIFRPPTVLLLRVSLAFQVCVNQEGNTHNRKLIYDISTFHINHFWLRCSQSEIHSCRYCHRVQWLHPVSGQLDCKWEEPHEKSYFSHGFLSHSQDVEDRDKYGSSGFHGSRWPTKRYNGGIFSGLCVSIPQFSSWFLKPAWG